MDEIWVSGQTVYQRPDSAFENDMFIGGTYVVTVDAFFMLAELLPGDMEEINKLRRQALEKTHKLDGDKLIFISTEY